MHLAADWVYNRHSVYRFSVHSTLSIQLVRNKMKHRIALLLKCMDAYIEPLEAAIFIPHVGEKRICPKHGEQEVVKVDIPYWVEDNEEDKVKGQ